MNQLINHEEITIEAEFDIEPAQDGGRTDPSWDAHLVDCAYSIDIDENVEALAELVHIVIGEEFEWATELRDVPDSHCSIFINHEGLLLVIEYFYNDEYVVDDGRTTFCGQLEIKGCDLLDCSQNDLLLDELLDQELANQDHPDA